MSTKNELITELENLQKQAEQDLAGSLKEKELQAWRTTYLGRSAELVQIFKRLSESPPDERARVGQLANQIKNNLEILFNQKLEKLNQEQLEENLQSERLDVTLPGRKPARGRLHIQTRVLREICHIFAEMGFQIFRGPEVESDEFNFELLNIPAYHPARDQWDTFFTTKEGVILRTHTSPGQVRSMRAYAPDPIRVILPGMCYRYEQMDASHEIQFYQVEVLAVGKDITFANMKGTLEEFAQRMYGEQVRTRIRPSYFPFTEPSGEMDIECFVCGAKGCPVCKGSGWLEILGCGMVHPIVLKNGGYDPQVYSGFAAGLGIERISMLRYRIDDIRHFWGNDVRFLEQF